jgi:hypothetical protein
LKKRVTGAPFKRLALVNLITSTVHLRAGPWIREHHHLHDRRMADEHLIVHQSLVWDRDSSGRMTGSPVMRSTGTMIGITGGVVVPDHRDKDRAFRSGEWNAGVWMIGVTTIGPDRMTVHVTMSRLTGAERRIRSVRFRLLVTGPEYSSSRRHSGQVSAGN